MQSNNEKKVEKNRSTVESKWSTKRNNKTSDNSMEMKAEIGFDVSLNTNSSKTSPNKSINSNKTNDKSKTNTNSNNCNNKRTKVSQIQNQIKARLALNASAVKSISNLRPSHVFANTAHSTRPTAPTVSNQASDMASGGLTISARPSGPDCSAPAVHHSFISDITDVRQMETSLLQLLEDFHSGKLQAFGQDITFEKMESVREQQERLARLHFELNLQQEVYGHQTEEGKRMAKDNMTKLIENLQQLSDSIEQLQSRSSVANTGS